MLPKKIPSSKKEILLGFTKKEEISSIDSIALWQILLMDKKGKVISKKQSFLWQKIPEKREKNTQTKEKETENKFSERTVTEKSSYDKLERDGELEKS